MRCARVDSLLDRFVDGTLEETLSAELSTHVQACARCTGRLALAERLAAGLASAGALAAPKGFARRVMDEVYRQALAGVPQRAEALSGAEAAGRDAEEREARRVGFYRRLGLTFMLSAGLLAASLLIPRASYPTLIRSPRAAAEVTAGGPLIVKNLLAGAGRVVQGTLGDAARAPAETPGGGAK